MLKILHLYYFSGSGGKFISNCLSMSGKVAFPNFDIFEHYWKTQNIQIIENALLATVPEKNKSRTWGEKEQGCDKLFGTAIFDNLRRICLTQDMLSRLFVFEDCWLPIISHDKKKAQSVNQFFSNHKIFFLGMLGNKDFTNLAIQLKWPSETHCLDLDLFRDFKQEFETMHFDYMILDWNPMTNTNLVEIEKLSELLDVKYNNCMSANYINKYIEFHRR